MSRKIIEKNRDKILELKLPAAGKRRLRAARKAFAVPVHTGYVVKYAEEKCDDELNGNYLRGAGRSE